MNTVRWLIVAFIGLLGLLVMLSALMSLYMAISVGLVEVRGTVAEFHPGTDILVVDAEPPTGRAHFRFQSWFPDNGPYPPPRLRKSAQVVLLATKIQTSRYAGPSLIYDAVVDGIHVTRLADVKTAGLYQAAYASLIGMLFWLLGFWLWYDVTRTPPNAVDRLIQDHQIAKAHHRHPVLMKTAAFVMRVRDYIEWIPLFGKLSLVLLYFAILPLYIVVFYVTAAARPRTAAFCFYGYWIALTAVLAIAIAGTPIPGIESLLKSTEEELAERLWGHYVLLNIIWGGAIRFWMAIMSDRESRTSD